MYLQYKNLKIEDVKFFFIGNVILFVKKKIFRHLTITIKVL